MTTFHTTKPDGLTSEMTRATAEPAAIESTDSKRTTFRRFGVLATALVALVAAVALFGLAFPQLLAPAVAIAVLAVIVALDWLLPSGELRQTPGIHWMR